MENEQRQHEATDSTSHEQQSTPTQPQAPISIADAIDSVADDVEVVDERSAARARDERGRFAAKADDGISDTLDAPPGADETDLQADHSEGADVQPVEVPGLNAPASWSPEEKAFWANLPREAQEAVLRREKDAQTQFERYAQQLNPISQALEPVRQNLALAGISEGQYVSQLVAAAQYLESDPQQAILWLCQQKGVDPSSLVPAREEYADEINPTIANLQNKVTQLEQQLAQGQQRVQQATLQQRQAQVDAFAAENPHFDAVSGDMLKLLQAFPQMELKEAYDRATWANPDVRQKLLSEQSAAAEAKRRQEAALKAQQAQRIAKATPRSTTATTATPQVASGWKGIGDAIDMAANEIL